MSLITALSLLLQSKVTFLHRLRVFMSISCRQKLEPQRVMSKPCKCRTAFDPRSFVHYSISCIKGFSYGYMGNFSPTIAMRFSEIIALSSREKKLQTGYTVCWQYLQIEKLQEYSEFSVFMQFFRGYCNAGARHATHRNLYVPQQCNNFLKLPCHRK